MKDRILLFIIETTPYSITEVEKVFEMVGESIDKTIHVLAYATANHVSCYDAIDILNYNTK